MRFQVRVNGPRGEEKIIDVCETQRQMETITVLNLKKIVIREFFIKDDIRMVFRTQTMDDSLLVTSYGIKHMSTIHAVIRLDGGVH